MSQAAETKKKPKKLPLPIKLAVGAVAGCTGTSIIFPIDMVKTRLQASAAGTYSGPLDAFSKIVRNEGGYFALYRGLGPNLVGVGSRHHSLLLDDYYSHPLTTLFIISMH